MDVLIAVVVVAGITGFIVWLVRRDKTPEPKPKPVPRPPIRQPPEPKEPVVAAGNLSIPPEVETAEVGDPSMRERTIEELERRVDSPVDPRRGGAAIAHQFAPADGTKVAVRVKVEDSSGVPVVSAKVVPVDQRWKPQPSPLQFFNEGGHRIRDLREEILTDRNGMAGFYVSSQQPVNRWLEFFVDGRLMDWAKRGIFFKMTDDPVLRTEYHERVKRDIEDLTHFE